MHFPFLCISTCTCTCPECIHARVHVCVCVSFTTTDCQLRLWCLSDLSVAMEFDLQPGSCTALLQGGGSWWDQRPKLSLFLNARSLSLHYWLFILSALTLPKRKHLGCRWTLIEYDITSGASMLGCSIVERGNLLLTCDTQSLCYSTVPVVLWLPEDKRPVSVSVGVWGGGGGGGGGGWVCMRGWMCVCVCVWVGGDMKKWEQQ